MCKRLSVILISALLLSFGVRAAAQTVTNVRAIQNEDNIVVTYYLDEPAESVRLTVSTDGGKTFSAPLQKVSGYLENVPAGRHYIKWNVLEEYDSFVGDEIQFRVFVVGDLETVPESVSGSVDLGLSVKWATCNLGASSPEEYGGYYQWAGLEDVTSTNIYLDGNNCPYHIGLSAGTGWTKYIPSGKLSYWSGSGSPDNKIVLDPEDDVAHVKLGGKWRMPTDAEWTELRENCTWTWTTQNGVKGYKVTSEKSGYTGNSIFLPAAGSRSNDYLGSAGSIGGYWSSSLRTGYPDYAYRVFFSSNDVYGYYGYRYSGRSIRPVSE